MSYDSNLFTKIFSSTVWKTRPYAIGYFTSASKSLGEKYENWVYYSSENTEKITNIEFMTAISDLLKEEE